MLRSDHSSARASISSGVGLVAGAQRPLDHPGGVVEAAQHPGHVAPRRVRQLPLGQRLDRLALEVDDLPARARCAGSGRGAGRRGSAGRRGRPAWRRRRTSPAASRRAPPARVRRRVAASSRPVMIAASSAAAAAGRVSEGKWSRRASCTSRSASPSRVASPAKSPPDSWACTLGRRANSDRTLASARSQPSLAVRRNCCSIASCRRSGPPSSTSSQPYSAATCSDPARVSTSCT